MTLVKSEDDMLSHARRKNTLNSHSAFFTHSAVYILYLVYILYPVCGLQSAVCILGKISARPHTTLCIQFLDRGNNDKNQYIVVGKTDLFYNSMRLCGNVLPHFVLTGIRGTNTVKIPVCELILHFRFLLHKYSFLL